MSLVESFAQLENAVKDSGMLLHPDFQTVYRDWLVYRQYVQQDSIGKALLKQLADFFTKELSKKDSFFNHESRKVASEAFARELSTALQSQQEKDNALASSKDNNPNSVLKHGIFGTSLTKETTITPESPNHPPQPTVRTKSFS